MIRLDSISKQNGHQLLFIDASMALQKGEKVGLVGPNGAGKTTIFRMIAGQEQPDDGAVLVEGGMTIGYFSQDVGEMSGRSSRCCRHGWRGTCERAGGGNGRRSRRRWSIRTRPTTWTP